MSRVYLRALEASDLDRTHRWHNDPTLYAALTSPFRYVSRAAEEEWLRKRGAYSTDQVSLAICLVDGDTHIGNAYLKRIDWVVRKADFAIFIGDPEQRGKGYGREAMELSIRHARRDLGLQRLSVVLLAGNEASIRLNERCGFKREGLLRRHAFKDGRLVDVLVMGLCFDDDDQAADAGTSPAGGTA